MQGVICRQEECEIVVPFMFLGQVDDLPENKEHQDELDDIPQEHRAMEIHRIKTAGQVIVDGIQCGYR